MRGGIVPPPSPASGCGGCRILRRLCCHGHCAAAPVGRCSSRCGGRAVCAARRGVPCGARACRRRRRLPVRPDARCALCMHSKRAAACGRGTRCAYCASWYAHSHTHTSPAVAPVSPRAAAKCRALCASAACTCRNSPTDVAHTARHLAERTAETFALFLATAESYALHVETVSMPTVHFGAADVEPAQRALLRLLRVVASE